MAEPMGFTKAILPAPATHPTLGHWAQSFWDGTSVLKEQILQEE